MRIKKRLLRSLCFLSTAMALVCSAKAANLANGLAAYWTLDNGSTATGSASAGVIDSVGSANGTIMTGNGTVTTGITGIVNQGVRFASSSDTRPQINIGNNNSATSVLSSADQSFSISLWFNLTNTSTYQTLLGFGNVSSFNQGISLNIDGRNGVVVRAYKGSDGNSRIGLTKGGALEANTWYNLVVVFDRSAGVVVGYLNGLGSGTTGDPSSGIILHNGWTTGGGGGVTNMILGDSASFGTPSLNLVYGANGSFGAPQHGALDELAIWNRALSKTEVEALYAEQLNGRGILEIPEPSAVAGIFGTLALAFACISGIRRRRLSRR